MSSNPHEKGVLDKLKAGLEEFKEGFLANANMVKESLDLTFGSPQGKELPNPGSVDLDLDYPKKETERSSIQASTPSSSLSKPMSHAGLASSKGAMTGQKELYDLKD